MFIYLLFIWVSCNACLFSDLIQGEFNTHYKLWGLVVETKMVRFCIGTHVQKFTVFPLKPKHHNKRLNLLHLRYQWLGYDLHHSTITWCPVSAIGLLICHSLHFVSCLEVITWHSYLLWCLFIILLLKLSCHSLAVCCCSIWLTTSLGNMLIWCYCTAKLSAMGGLLISCKMSVFHTARHLHTPSLPRIISGPQRWVHSLPAGLTVVLHGKLEEAVLHAVEEDAMTSTRRVVQRFNVDQKTVWHILHNQ